jgi:hypothetical protein
MLDERRAFPREAGDGIPQQSLGLIQPARLAQSDRAGGKADGLVGMAQPHLVPAPDRLRPIARDLRQPGMFGAGRRVIREALHRLDQYGIGFGETLGAAQGDRGAGIADVMVRHRLPDLCPALDRFGEFAAPISEPCALDCETRFVRESNRARGEQLFRLIEAVQLRQDRGGPQIWRGMLRKPLAQVAEDAEGGVAVVPIACVFGRRERVVQGGVCRCADRVHFQHRSVANRQARHSQESSV